MFAVRFISALLLSHETRFFFWIVFLGVWLVACCFPLCLQRCSSPSWFYFHLFLELLRTRQRGSTPTVDSVCSDIRARPIFSHFTVSGPPSLNPANSFLFSYCHSNPSITPFHSFIPLAALDTHKSALRLAAKAPRGPRRFISPQNLLLTQIHKQRIQRLSGRTSRRCRASLREYMSRRDENFIKRF